MLWAGRIMEARELMDRFNRLNPEGAVILTARQACVEGRRAEVEALLLTIDPNNNNGHSARWHLLKLLGKEISRLTTSYAYLRTAESHTRSLTS